MIEGRLARAQDSIGTTLTAVVTRVIVCLATVSIVAVVSLPAFGADVQQRVVDAALATYVHGVTPEIAQTEVGTDGVAVLLQLLADPNFPRRDNVVAFLTHLGGDDATRALEQFLKRPPAPVGLPEEDRALLLAPQALGHIAARGSRRALQALLAMTDDGAGGGVLASAAARANNPAPLRDDLLHMALRGLAFADDDAATARLQEIASGWTVPAPGGRDLRPDAQSVRPVPGNNTPAAKPEATLDGQSEAAGPDGSLAAALDTEGVVHDSAIDYANHVDHNNPINDARVDAILGDASMRVGRDDFDTDVACCVGFSRQGSQKTFGSSGDGKDIIDSSSEVSSVLSDSSARVKVVRLINYCSGPGTNIIGCGWIGGKGIAVVRYGDVDTEGALWVHEYGHNVGLGHDTSSNRLIMYPYLGNNDGVTQAHCDQYHYPSSGAQADLASVGACTDNDIDDVHDVVDNCPTVPNFDQSDANGDGIGDVCETGCGNGVVDGGEQCDGSDFGGASCTSLGFDGGSLSCQSDCTIVTAGCFACGNGIRESGEECDGADLGGSSCASQQCTGGTPDCSASCTLNFSTCTGCPVCDNDGLCEPDENCNGCQSDCLASDGAQCGNGVCEAGNGENCVSCPSDCNGKQNGKPSRRYCCGFGGDGPVGCDDSRCVSGGYACTAETSVPSCCGDGTCNGVENSDTCELDCGPPPPPPVCGDDACDEDEDSCSCAADCGAAPAEVCDDGIDNDCDLAVDCNDTADCNNASACVCAVPGAPCASNSECCSFACKGKRGEKTCR